MGCASAASGLTSQRRGRLAQAFTGLNARLRLLVAFRFQDQLALVIKSSASLPPDVEMRQMAKKPDAGPLLRPAGPKPKGICNRLRIDTVWL
jgi:hypothetical protein